MQIDLTCQFDLNHTIVRRNRAVLDGGQIWNFWIKSEFLDPQNHDFGGFDQGSCDLPLFKA